MEYGKSLVRMVADKSAAMALMVAIAVSVFATFDCLPVDGRALASAHEISFRANEFRQVSPAQIRRFLRAQANAGVNFHNRGVVCEQIAFMLLRMQLPPDQFIVDRNVRIEGRMDKVLGELDIVVFSHALGRVVLVGEVKCWSNLNKAANKADRQLKVFAKAVDQRRGLQLISKRGHRFQRKHFMSGPVQYIRIGPKGAGLSGFELELPISLHQMETHFTDISEYQSQRQCEAMLAEL